MTSPFQNNVENGKEYHFKRNDKLQFKGENVWSIYLQVLKVDPNSVQQCGYY